MPHFQRAFGEEYQSALLAFYADRTGGTVVSPKRDDTGKGLEELLFGIRAEYSLGWKPPTGDGFHKVRIELVSAGPTVHHKSGDYTGPPLATAPPPADGFVAPSSL